MAHVTWPRKLNPRSPAGAVGYSMGDPPVTFHCSKRMSDAPPRPAVRRFVAGADEQDYGQLRQAVADGEIPVQAGI